MPDGIRLEEIDDLSARPERRVKPTPLRHFRKRGVAAWRPLALRATPRALWRRHKPSDRIDAAWRAQAGSHGHRSAVRNRTRFGVERPRWIEWLRACRGQLYEEAHRRPYRDDNLR